MNKLIGILFSGLVAAGAIACDSGGTGGTGGTGGAGGNGGTGGTGGDAGGGGSGGGGAPGFPDPPVLGAQIDRMGRPAINTALNHTFDGVAATKDAAKDAWNAAPEAMFETFAGEVRGNLAILDSLDTVCGNQAAACGIGTPCMGTPTVMRYTTLAGLLANDKLWVKLTGTCGEFAPTQGYLAIEAGVLGLVNNDCGGRTLKADVIQTSYTLLAAGAAPFLSMPPMPIDDTVGANAGKTGGSTFPFLAPPM